MNHATTGTPAAQLTIDDLKARIRDIPDFPQPGIIFRDITPLLADADSFQAVVHTMAAPFRDKVDTVVAIESRGLSWDAVSKTGKGEGRVSVADAIEEGDTETLREDLIEAFSDEDIEEIERRIDSGDFYDFISEILDEWSCEDAEELFELLEAQLAEVDVDLKYSAPDEEEAEEEEEDEGDDEEEVDFEVEGEEEA